MSRQAAPRNLTLTEELDRLEQQITLTLQEIDSNFNKAHRIVTSSIIPIVEQYAKHSNDVWQSSEFWKVFFEYAANVSLDNYEEPALEEDVTLQDTTDPLQTPTGHGQSAQSGAEAHDVEEEGFGVDSPTQVTGVQMTPKLPPSTAKRINGAGKTVTSSTGRSKAAKASLRSPSPRKYTGRNPRALEPSSEEPSTPQARGAEAYAASSPFEPESAYQPPVLRSLRHNNDPLLHHVLDSNYRVRATPHTQRQQRRAAAAPKATLATATKRAAWDDSPQSSPEVKAPQLRSDLFSPANAAPGRTPGISVLTPARNRLSPATSTGRQLFSPQDRARYTSGTNRTSHIFEDDSDDSDDFGGMSPPKTMQFHVPQSRLLQTPAREASKRIVEDLLLTAGADATDEIEGDEIEGYEEASPSMVRNAYDVEDDTF